MRRIHGGLVGGCPPPRPLPTPQGLKKEACPAPPTNVFRLGADPSPNAPAARTRQTGDGAGQGCLGVTLLPTLARGKHLTIRNRIRPWDAATHLGKLLPWHLINFLGVLYAIWRRDTPRLVGSPGWCRVCAQPAKHPHVITDFPRSQTCTVSRRSSAAVPPPASHPAAAEPDPGMEGAAAPPDGAARPLAVYAGEVGAVLPWLAALEEGPARYEVDALWVTGYAVWSSQAPPRRGLWKGGKGWHRGRAALPGGGDAQSLSPTR